MDRYTSRYVQTERWERRRAAKDFWSVIIFLLVLSVGTGFILGLALKTIFS